MIARFVFKYNFIFSDVYFTDNSFHHFYFSRYTQPNIWIIIQQTLEAFYVYNIFFFQFQWSFNLLFSIISLSVTKSIDTFSNFNSMNQIELNFHKISCCLPKFLEIRTIANNEVMKLHLVNNFSIWKYFLVFF